jgi:FlaA1/EpsC-like NDP-sugar epimerase
MRWSRAFASYCRVGLRMRRPSFLGLLVLDIVLAGVAYAAAYLIRLEPPLYGIYLPTILRTTPVVMALAAASFLATGLYRSLPRYASLDTLIAVVRSSTAAVALAGLAIFLVWRGGNVPRSVLLIQWMVMILLLGGVRLWPRLRRYAAVIPLRAARADRIPVIVYGAGDAGAAIVREMRSRSEMAYWPVGFIDDDPAKQGRTVHGRRVLGTGADLGRVAKETEVREIFVAIPSASGVELRRIVERCSRQVPGVIVKTLPGLADLITGRVSVTAFHEVRIEDLLKRSPRDLDPQRIRDFIRGKVVFVTGAGGSIGSELCRQVAACAPAELIMFEQTEYNLYTIDREIEERFAELRRQAALGDASHRTSVEPVILRTRPQILFHAAAYKHVHLLEQNPCEGVANNVLGVLNTAQAADAAGVGHFVFISTDKAVRPVSVMGAAKRLGEMIIQLMAERSRTHFNVVRFGNVLGSSGSVIPRFADQIRRGLPITITDPQVTRYFMLTSEAVQLVMQAASLGRSGDIFVLDMGEPVSILELARDVAQLMGVSRDGEPQVELEYTGLRPGEKLHEELRWEATAERPTGFESILVEGYRTALSWEELQAGLDRLIQAARGGEVEHTIAALRELVPEYEPATPEYARVLPSARRASP